MNPKKPPEYIIIHQKRPKETDKRTIAQTSFPDTIKVYDIRQIEETLSHEIEHLTLYHLCLQHNCNQENAKFASMFINDPSDGDIEQIKITLHILNYHKWNYRKLDKIMKPFEFFQYTFEPINEIPPITYKHKTKHK